MSCQMELTVKTITENTDLLANVSTDCEIVIEITDTPTPPWAGIDDNAGIGDKGVAWSADKSARELAGKVDAEAGMGLSELSFTTADKLSLDQSEQDRHTHNNKTVIDGLSDDAGVLQYKGLPISDQAALDAKVDKVAGKSLVPDTEIAKLLTVQEDATANRDDELNADKIHEHVIADVAGLEDSLTELYTQPTDAAAAAGTSDQIGAWSPAKWRKALEGAVQQVEGESKALPISQKGFTIITKDRLRASVEAVSGGKNTVIYDAQGNPNVMVVIPRFNLEDLPFGLSNGTHPAFLTNGVPRSEVLIAKYLASTVGSGTQVMAGKVPSTSVSLDTARSLCTSKGAGWSLTSAHVWSAVSLLSIANATQPRGNTYYGRSHAKPYETGRRHDGLAPGEASGIASTLTGSGPESWYHDGTYFGVADLVGNVWEWVDQLKLVDGCIVSTVDNNPALPEAAWTQHPAFLTVVGSALQMSGEAGEPGIGSVGIRENMVKQASYVSSNLLKTLLVEPLGETIAGYIAANTAGERMAIRGGNWNSASSTGLGSLDLNYARSFSHSRFGFRPAFVI